MKFFLRYVNPLLALAVMVICFISALGEKGGRIRFFEDSIPTYFLAKGIFCSAALFLLGKLVEQGMSARRGLPHPERSKTKTGSNPSND